jgi:lipopolysaccharide transport system ATP-binding protein
MSTVIEVENLFKQYRLGQVSTGSIAHDLNRWWHSVRGNEDPYEKITGVNNREEITSNEYVWALQDINFSVKQGEVLGIIGRNGAGKSTLLKILSKVTAPTKGSIKVKGRIASLLEVGTGFHPELTGRENIFLNGAILGMTKSEIRSKFDEIVAFSGVEKYIDTPVKRYSSGMYVRLAFAVAAHLEPEILIVDEVLAVGDAEFQKKCLGKMKDVSNQGRTVLFVRHNIQAIESLCDRVILMSNGKKQEDLLKNETIKYYLENTIKQTKVNSQSGTRENDHYGKRVRIENVNCKSEFYWQDKISLSFTIKNLDSLIDNIEFGIGISSMNGQRIFTYESKDSFEFSGQNELTFNVKFEQPTLVPGSYLISIGIRSLTYTLDFLEFVKEFSISEIDCNGNHFGFSLGEASGFIDSNVKVEIVN